MRADGKGTSPATVGGRYIKGKSARGKDAAAAT